MRKLRLLLTEECNRNCPGCCNNDWDLSTLPIETDFTGYDEILITGGEPMLYPGKVILTAIDIRNQNPDARIYVYTAKTDKLDPLIGVMATTDGLTITLHHQNDVVPFLAFESFIQHESILADIRDTNKSLRLNVFAGISIPEISWIWEVKKDMVWIENCSLPEGEVFKKLA